MDRGSNTEGTFVYSHPDCIGPQRCLHPFAATVFPEHHVLLNSELFEAVGAKNLIPSTKLTGIPTVQQPYQSWQWHHIVLQQDSMRLTPREQHVLRCVSIIHTIFSSAKDMSSFDNPTLKGLRSLSVDFTWKIVTIHGGQQRRNRKTMCLCTCN